MTRGSKTWGRRESAGATAACTTNSRSASPAASTPLRVGRGDHLSAAPLVEYLAADGVHPLIVSSQGPEALRGMLRSGEMELTWVPVMELLEKEAYRVVPDAGISIYGEAQHARLYRRAPLRDAELAGLLDFFSRLERPTSFPSAQRDIPFLPGGTSWGFCGTSLFTGTALS